MALTRSKKYTILTIIFFGLFYVAYQYNGIAASASSEEKFKVVLLGIGLYIISSVVIIARAYYKNGVDQSQVALDLQVAGGLAREKTKNITVKLMVSVDECRELRLNGKLFFHPSRIEMPLRYGDRVELRMKDGGKWGEGNITKIDGVNQRIELTLESESKDLSVKASLPKTPLIL